MNDLLFHWGTVCLLCTLGKNLALLHPIIQKKQKERLVFEPQSPIPSLLSPAVYVGEGVAARKMDKLDTSPRAPVMCLLRCIALLESWLVFSFSSSI